MIRSSHTPPRSGIRILLALYGLLLLILSAVLLGNQYFWADEIYSIELAQMELLPMLAATAADVHPPLYYILLKLFCCVFGYHPLVYRLVSYIPAVILVFVAAGPFTRDFGIVPAAFFLTCATMVPFSLNVHTEVRMYSWALLFVTLCGYGLYVILKENSRRAWILFTTMGIASAYTHYYAFLAIAFLYLMLLIFQLAAHKGAKAWLRCFLVSAASYLPWIPAAVPTLFRTGESFWLNSIPSPVYVLSTMYEENLPGILVTAMSLILIIAYLFLERGTPEHALAVSSLATAAGVLIVAYTASCLIHPVLLSRYYYPSCGLLWLSTGIAGQEIASRLRQKWLGLMAITAVFAGGMLAWNYKFQLMINYNNGISSAQHYLEDTAGPDDLLLTTVTYRSLNETFLRLYFPAFEIDTLPEGARSFPERDSIFLFTDGQAYSADSIENLAAAGGMSISEEQPVYLGEGYTVYHITK